MRNVVKRRRAAGGVVAVTVVVAVGVAGGLSAAAADQAPHGPTPTIAWGACPAQAPDAAPRDPHLACGTLTVPLDYRNPRGASIELAVSRRATAEPGKRRGVLLLNPGGPALPGLDLPDTVAPTLPSTVLERYDLIGFDPRGVANSTPQSCNLSNPSVSAVFPYPGPGGAITANVTLARTVARQCAATVGNALQHFTTANTARDMDSIRQALGVQRISYWGQSYGTYLGTVYATLFPDHTDRMVLEGNVDPTRVWSNQLLDYWGRGLAERFPDAARVAAAQHDALGLGASVPDVTRTYLTLADRLDRRPVPVPGAPASVDGALLRNVTYQLLLHDQDLPALVQFWKAAADLADGRLRDTDAAMLRQVLADGPTTPGVPADNQITMFLALVCGDAPWPTDVAGYATRVAADRARWPLSAGMPANINACAFWPTRPIEAPVTVTDHGPRTILLLQNRRDHATPWDSALGLRRALGQRAAFIGVDQGGHYVYHEGSACADRATITFLDTGALPAADGYCTDVIQQ